MRPSSRLFIRLTALALLFLLAAALANHCRPVNRATLSLLRAVPKTAPGPDAPLDLLRVLAPFQKHLAPDFAVTVPDFFEIRGRDNALQALQLLRRMSDSIALGPPVLTPVSRDSSQIHLDLTVPLDIQFSPAHAAWLAGHPLSPALRASLLWSRTKRAWRLRSATLFPFENMT